MSALAASKTVSKEFKGAASPQVMDDRAWQAELEQNTRWIDYHRTVINVMRYGDPRAVAELRSAAVAQLVECIEKNNTPEAAAKLGAEAFAYALCELKGYVEREAFDVEFATATLNIGPGKRQQDDLKYDIELASDHLVQHLGELNVIKSAQKHVSAEDFGVALLARLLARASNDGFRGEAEALREKLDANFDVAEAVGNTLRSGAGDYFNFSVMTEDGKPKAQSFLVVPKPGTQYIN